MEDVQENVDQINFILDKLVLVPLDTNEKELVALRKLLVVITKSIATIKKNVFVELNLTGLVLSA